MGNNPPVSSDGNDAFEIDLNEDNYEKINPLLSLGNSARFIHDFSAVCFIFILNYKSLCIM